MMKPRSVLPPHEPEALNSLTVCSTVASNVYLSRSSCERASVSTIACIAWSQRAAAASALYSSP
jgi:hypothetical protein